MANCLTETSPIECLILGEKFERRMSNSAVFSLNYQVFVAPIS